MISRIDTTQSNDLYSTFLITININNWYVRVFIMKWMPHNHIILERFEWQKFFSAQIHIFKHLPHVSADDDFVPWNSIIPIGKPLQRMKLKFTLEFIRCCARENWKKKRIKFQHQLLLCTRNINILDFFFLFRSQM